MRAELKMNPDTVKVIRVHCGSKMHSFTFKFDLKEFQERRENLLANEHKRPEQDTTGRDRSNETM